MGFDFYGGAYPLHVDSKSGRGSYATAGFAFPGTPGIALGQNDTTVWTATSAFGDNMDLVLAGDPKAWPDQLLELLVRTASRGTVAKADALGNTGFQISRGLLGVST